MLEVTKMSHPERKKKYVDSVVQGALVRRIIFHWIQFIVVTVVASFLLQVLSNPMTPLKAHFNEMWWTHGPLLAVMVFMIPIFVLDTIKLSHRFAGPVYRLRKSMQSISEGKSPEKIKFRKNDFWQELADDYNEMLETLTLENKTTPTDSKFSETPESEASEIEELVTF